VVEPVADESPSSEAQEPPAQDQDQEDAIKAEEVIEQV
jgi:hypothetical protein